MIERPQARDLVMSAYREMPGLRLTVQQASRLFGLELRACEVLLTGLVSDGVLDRYRQYFVARTAA